MAPLQIHNTKCGIKGCNKINPRILIKNQPIIGNPLQLNQINILGSSASRIRQFAAKIENSHIKQTHKTVYLNVNNNKTATRNKNPNLITN